MALTEQNRARRAGEQPVRRPRPAMGPAASGPFAGAGLGIGVAFAAIVVSLVWRLAPGAPGERWPAVHLFTLGALTPLIATFMPRFAAALLHTRPLRRDGERSRTMLVILGAGLTISGRLTGNTPLLAVGAAVLSFAIGWLYVALRRERRSALPARFVFIVRAYEHACAAFLHGALLGALLGAGVFRGEWYGAARAAHLQLMLLGWAGITLLATVVMFGPAVMRARMEEGADAIAARWIPHAATALSLAALALLATGAGGTVGAIARSAAGAALVVYLWTALRVCVPVIRTAARANRSAATWFMAAATIWFMAAVALDTASVFAAKMIWTDAAAVVFLVGVLLHAILASLTHVLPLLLGRDAARRAEIGDRLSALPRARTIVLSAGATLAAAGTGMMSEIGSDLARIGWMLVAACIAVTLILVVFAATKPGAARE
ncbi:MAG: hypothetical protein ACRDKG_11525 [Actinomycetota bacterium]